MSVSIGRKPVILLSMMSVLLLCSIGSVFGAAPSGSEQSKLRKVVIDAGHGGKDPGCVSGSNYEKNITLSIAKKLGALITKNCPETDVVYTRSTDVYVDLVERGRVANKANADLFISVHINASTNSTARGTSTHVMGMDKSSKNLEVTMRENDVITYEDDYSTKYEGYNPGDPASYIMFSLMQYAHQDQSMMFAQTVQKHFKKNLPMPDRGTTQEPFLVLWRTSMPSVLVEVGFISNQTDRTYITSEDGQDEAARSLFNAFSEYKSKVEGRANVVELEQVRQIQRQAAASSAAQAQSNAVAAQNPQADQNGVLFYAQISFLADSKPKNDKCFKSYKGCVSEVRVPGKGYRYLIGGVTNYREAMDMLAKAKKEFPESFLIAYDNGVQIDVATARRKTGQ